MYTTMGKSDLHACKSDVTKKSSLKMAKTITSMCIYYLLTNLLRHLHHIQSLLCSLMCTAIAAIQELVLLEESSIWLVVGKITSASIRVQSNTLLSMTFEGGSVTYRHTCSVDTNKMTGRYITWRRLILQFWLVPIWRSEQNHGKRETRPFLLQGYIYADYEKGWLIRVPKCTHLMP